MAIFFKKTLRLWLLTLQIISELQLKIKHCKLRNCQRFDNFKSTLKVFSMH